MITYPLIQNPGTARRLARPLLTIISFLCLIDRKSSHKLMPLDVYITDNVCNLAVSSALPCSQSQIKVNKYEQFRTDSLNASSMPEKVAPIDPMPMGALP